jgi:hypothetical protein
MMIATNAVPYFSGFFGGGVTLDPPEGGVPGRCPVDPCGWYPLFSIPRG